MDDYGKFSKTSFSEIEDYYSSLNMEDITDAYQRHAKIVWEDFEKKNIDTYHSFYKLEAIQNF